MRAARFSVTERAGYIGRVRTLSRAVAQAYYDSREKLGFPMCKTAAESFVRMAGPAAAESRVQALSRSVTEKYNAAKAMQDAPTMKVPAYKAEK